jgi:glycerophosphoryl diester phosphodiesterase
MHAGSSGTLVCGDRPWVVAHRGAWGEAPQNSLQAFEDAVSLGCDAVEIDVRRTSDGRLVVVHDARIGGRSVAASEHGELRARSGDDRPHTLEEVLERLAGRIAVDIELKEDGYVELAMAQIARRLEPDQYVLTSFIDGVLDAARRAVPDITSGLLLHAGETIEVVRSRLASAPTSDRPYPGQTQAKGRRRERGNGQGRERGNGQGREPGNAQGKARGRERDLARRVAAAKVDFLAPHASLTRAGILAWAAQHELPTWVWTVNDARSLRALLRDDRVTAVISDRPARAIALRPGSGGRA